VLSVGCRAVTSNRQGEGPRGNAQFIRTQLEAGNRDIIRARAHRQRGRGSVGFPGLPTSDVTLGQCLLRISIQLIAVAVPVAVDVLVVRIAADTLGSLGHERGAVVVTRGRAVRHSTTELYLQAPNALFASAEAEGEVGTIASDINRIGVQVDLVLNRELAAELRSCRNVRGEAQREDGSQGQSRKALHPCVSPSVSRVSRPSRWHPKGSPASGQCFLAD